MADEPQKKSEGVWGRLVSELVGFIPKDMREMIGVQVGIYLFIFTPMIIIGGVIFLTKAFKETPTPEVPCWQIQKVEERVFKLNTCTGETIELSPDNEASKATTQKKK